ncbi:MAG: hypothetical protein GY743_16810 [Planctomycetaceae bacterium]|nr:hypothetical protein [Planctomycetaceae bacterium]
MKNMFIELRNALGQITGYELAPVIRTGTPGKANPAGMKMWKRSLKTSKRGCDGTLRR